MNKRTKVVGKSVEQYKPDMVKNTIAAFNEGYRLGREYGSKVLGLERKIRVECSNENDGELEFTRFNGGIINYGRTLPF